MERTIKVTGKGKIAVKPDTIRLLIDLRAEKMDYEEALRLSAQQTGDLKGCFGKLGFEESELKTTTFRVNTKYENYQEKDRSWKKKFVGYECCHGLKIEFDADNKVLGKVLYALAHSLAEPQFRILYTIKDVEDAKNLLLGKAVEDSRTKAEMLTKAAGVKLVEVVSIDYSWDEVEIVSSPMNPMQLMRGVAEEVDGSYDMEIEPDDINVSDHVTVIWSIT